MDKIYKSEKELLDKAKSALDKPFREIDQYGQLKSLKGGIGQMVEECVFEYKPNSDSAPDFQNLGIELKTTPFVVGKGGKRKAKERLVLNIINYMTENLDDFEKSHFWYKNKEILMMFYEYQKDKPKEDWHLDNFILYKWPEEDLPIIKRDWSTIVNKIKEGKADTLSESDTLYLAACVKGATSESSVRQQPFSSVEAKQRAYSLKPSYMTYILNHYVYGQYEDEKIIKSSEELQTKSLEEIITDMVKPYLGKTQKELATEFNISNTKSMNSLIINKILKLNGNLENTEEFQKANIKPKTIRIEKNGTIAQSMSFPTFQFKDIVHQHWDESDFYNILSQTRFMFVIFQKTDDTDENSYLKGVKFWSMPEEDIQEAQKCWAQAVKTIKLGVILTPRPQGGFSNNLPSVKENRVSHVRPHASQPYYKFGDKEFGNQSNGSQLPDGRWMTKQCFWLNAKYIRSIVE